MPKETLNVGFTVNLSHWDNMESGRKEFIKLFMENEKANRKGNILRSI
jgi:hypothetical protein